MATFRQICASHGANLAGSFEPAQAHQPPGKRLLGGVLGELMVPEHVVRDRDHRGVVLLTQLAEAVQIARPGGFNQFSLGVDDRPSR